MPFDVTKNINWFPSAVSEVNCKEPRTDTEIGLYFALISKLSLGMLCQCQFFCLQNDAGLIKLKPSKNCKNVRQNIKNQMINQRDPSPMQF